MAPRDGPTPGTLVVRPVVEEFKAFAQERISEFERAKKVDALKVFLDAAELGIQVLLEVQMEAAEETPAIPPARGTEPLEPEEDRGIETEDLEPVEETDTRERPGHWNLPPGEEVLVGEEGAAAPPGDEEPSGETKPADPAKTAGGGGPAGGTKPAEAPKAAEGGAAGGAAAAPAKPPEAGPAGEGPSKKD